MAEQTPAWVTLAEVIRPRGNRGELLCVDLSKGPERYLELGRVTLFNAKEEELGQLAVEEAWLHQDQLILKFAGVDSISDAERFRGGEVRVPFSQRAPLAEGEYYLSDLPGCAVVDASTGEPLGTVAAAPPGRGPTRRNTAAPPGGCHSGRAGGGRTRCSSPAHRRIGRAGSAARPVLRRRRSNSPSGPADRAAL